MTKEELKRKYGIGFTTVLDSTGNRIDISERIARAYSDGATEATKELQEENAELKQRIEWLDMAIDSDIPIANKLAELEKENAELKEKYVKNITDCDICDTYCNSQLTKAKEIIKTFCGFCSVFNSTNGSFDNLIAKAEQFLKDNA